MGLIFARGFFAKNTKARKTRKFPPRENFHVYSMPNLRKTGVSKNMRLQERVLLMSVIS